MVLTAFEPNVCRDQSVIGRRSMSALGCWRQPRACPGRSADTGRLVGTVSTVLRLARRHFHAVLVTTVRVMSTITLTTQAHGACRSLSMRRPLWLLLLCLLPLAVENQAQKTQTNRSQRSPTVDPRVEMPLRDGWRFKLGPESADRKS